MIRGDQFLLKTDYQSIANAYMVPKLKLSDYRSYRFDVGNYEEYMHNRTIRRVISKQCGLVKKYFQK